MRHWSRFIPVQMTWSGRNLDVVTGLLAAVLGLVGWQLPEVFAPGAQPGTAVLVAFNTLGLVLLLNVNFTAVASLPTPLRQFPDPPANVWFTYAPFIWLPTILVQLALGFHVLLYRRLLSDYRSSAGRRGTEDSELLVT
jgi:hypothetical protein